MRAFCDSRRARLPEPPKEMAGSSLTAGAYGWMAQESHGGMAAALAHRGKAGPRQWLHCGLQGPPHLLFELGEGLLTRCANDVVDF